MYVTHILAGRAVQAFVPKPMMPSLSSMTLEAFRDVDGALLRSLDDACFPDACSIAVSQLGRSPLDVAKHRRVEAACLRFLRLPRCDARTLIAMNAQLIGTDRGGFRRSLAWMGGTHPASAWHVGSPVSQLQALVKSLVRMQSRDLPISLIALLSLLRMLQIHPFADGNGRTARLYACWLMRRYLGPALFFPRLIDALWSIARFDISAASNELRDEGSLELLRHYVIAVVDDLAFQPSKGDRSE